MSSTMDRREHSRRGSLDRSGSPVRDRHSPRRRSSPRKERSPVHRKISPVSRSPRRTTSSHRVRSPAREKIPDRDRSPKRARPRSPLQNGSPGSPSPPTRRLRRAQAGREEEKVVDRGQRDKGRQKERGEGRDVPSERRLVGDGNDGGSSRSTRRGRPVLPEERSPRRRYSSRSPPIENLLPGSLEDLYKGTTKRMKISREITDANEDDDLDSVAKMKAAEEALEAKKQKPSFELSGKLAEETNRVRGITLLFTEPPDARKPDVRWRLYVFKAGEVLNEPLYVHRQSCYLFGRERRVADIPTDHPSCSKQHAVIQFRLVEKEQSEGLLSKQVRPYVMDLGSTNGTFVNDNRIEPQRYYELFERDTVRFGNSSREYVLLHENSAE